MVKIAEAIVVEGRYDKNTLLQIVDAPVLQTDGFSVMNDKTLLSLLRRTARERGLIVFTDSDGAGFVIRNYLKGAIPTQYLKHAYIPDVYGKEKRKAAPGKEGKIGVEGMHADVILKALHDAGATFLGETEDKLWGGITKQDLCELQLSGCANSSVLREKLCRRLDLPVRMSTNAMLQALNLLYTKEELISYVKEIT